MKLAAYIISLIFLLPLLLSSKPLNSKVVNESPVLEIPLNWDGNELALTKFVYIKKGFKENWPLLNAGQIKEWEKADSSIRKNWAGKEWLQNSTNSYAIIIRSKKNQVVYWIPRLFSVQSSFSIFANGRLIHQNHKEDLSSYFTIPDISSSTIRDSIRVKLKKGDNILFFKIGNSTESNIAGVRAHETYLLNLEKGKEFITKESIYAFLPFGMNVMISI